MIYEIEMSIQDDSEDIEEVKQKIRRALKDKGLDISIDRITAV